MAGYLFHPAAEKELLSFPLDMQVRLIEKIKELCQLSHPLRSRNVKKLKGYGEPTFRLRDGNYRAMFVLRKSSLLYITEVESRQAGY